MAEIITTPGPKRSADLGMTMPHEYIFVDLRTWDTSRYTQAETEKVLR
jgi:predicted metal-dependent phosphotriesterase family hydrolase